MLRFVIAAALVVLAAAVVWNASEMHYRNCRAETSVAMGGDLAHASPVSDLVDAVNGKPTRRATTAGSCSHWPF